MDWRHCHDGHKRDREWTEDSQGETPFFPSSPHKRPSVAPPTTTSSVSSKRPLDSWDGSNQELKRPHVFVDLAESTHKRGFEGNAMNEDVSFKRCKPQLWENEPLRSTSRKRGVTQIYEVDDLIHMTPVTHNKGQRALIALNNQSFGPRPPVSEADLRSDLARSANSSLLKTLTWTGTQVPRPFGSAISVNNCNTALVVWQNPKDYFVERPPRFVEDASLSPRVEVLDSDDEDFGTLTDGSEGIVSEADDGECRPMDIEVVDW